MTRSLVASRLDRAIGARLRLFRKQANLNQSELGKALGVTFQQVQKYENGKNRLSGSRLIAVCNTLKITPDQLLGTDASVRSPAAILEMLQDRVTARMLMAVSHLPREQRRPVAKAMVELVRAFGGKI